MQSTTLTKAGVAALILLAAGCADMKAPTGNQTSYTTGSYRMPAKDQVAQAPAQVQPNGSATAADSRTRTSAPSDTTKVQAAQQALARAGYNPGNATGTMDVPTHDAVLQFQRARGLKATGDLDSSTMSALGVPLQ